MTAYAGLSTSPSDHGAGLYDHERHIYISGGLGFRYR